MFGLLKKKLNTFSEKLKHKKTEEIQEKEEPISKEEIQEEAKEVNRKEQLPIKEKKLPFGKEIEKEEKSEESIDEKIEETPSEKIKSGDATKEALTIEKETHAKEEFLTDEETIPKEKEEIIEKKEFLRAEEDKRELKAKVGKGKKLKSVFSGKIEISQKDLEELIWELELSLLESDVEQDTAKEITDNIQKRLVGQKVSIKNFDEHLKEEIKEILKEIMQTKKINLLEEIKNNEKPYVILIIGPNGAGKTTSIGKMTHYFQQNNLKCLWAAADTFRSGAIQQLQEHADKLGVKTIKQDYGADPAAVAFDAIKSAKANNLDVVLIDSAGRQETNKNLMEELRKIERVAKANLKIYVGEAYTGQGLLDMAKEFDEAIGIDGFILTKIDTDAKGGTTISLLYKLKKPIIFVGTGQEYTDFEEFSPEFVLNRII
jgi:fused signal recognition particle receptor